ncbi:lysophospholipid acyltransferase family protein [Kingella kingae]|uniref:lysophospholipid acyltransferase family protein n=1 Tax=Kingella kingae TaxID=504 RepID=UPI00056EB2DF|nr:lysophospholipid acyltransferase family protein [Kingella kingae]MDK4530367.1 lysophospholipid acyltransferase family protein [Kingella kingae]MDK4581127.1 lysophospholipid acyltransferase family protein [Kingella kingae]
MATYTINQWYRLFATALGFVIFGVFGVLFKLYLGPGKRFQSSLHTQFLARKRVTQSWYVFTQYLIKMGIVEAHFHGFDKLGRQGQMILANHPSLLDVVFILSRVPQANCIVKADLLHNPAMNSQIHACGYVLNQENLDFVEEIDRILQQQCLLVFPEGTRTGWDGEVKFHRGAVSMALRSAKVITPIAVKMSPPNYKKGQPWYRIPLQKPMYHFVVGDDIDPQTWLAEKPLPIAARRLNDYLQDYFNQQTCEKQPAHSITEST